ncbi:MAG: MFS transporter [Pseudotabrizicola sp.]|uniref:MFS transporter n=1 Tax=Pseudotabrizicola sp. TaxID=2939647 RepID=UPI002724B4A9|nr:MFS transporter [Pseudotabrizicola sp.]MDO8883629.1 MFS transporter [Pseudotabrizicola sp.]MDP2080597.1 MFS transporter [Pseudotabrizicola sp.]MDZ7573325.1 MFS transporter [Pseudotabrizicola sp.]
MTMTEARRARWAVAVMFTAAGFVMGAWAPQIPLLLPRHEITEFTLGILILVLGVGAVGAMLFTGRLIGRFGSVAVLRGFALSASAALPVVVFSPSMPVLVPAMALLGALIGCMDVAMNANAVEVERRLGRAIMSSSHGFWSLGGFVGGSAGAWVIAHWGAEVQAILVAMVTAAMVVAVMPILRGEAPAPAIPTIGTREKRILLPRDAGLWLLGAMALLSMVPEGAVLDWAALYLQKDMGSDVFRSGLGFAFFAGAMAIMRFAGDGVRNRFGAVLTLRISGLVAAAGMMLAAVAPGDTLAIAAFFITGLGVANMVPILFSAAGNYPGVASGTAIAAVTMIGYAGILVAPASIGFVAEVIGFRVTYAVLSLLLIVVALLSGRTAGADELRAVA